jgi:two-component system chemotaxis sensor kinase CheA
MARRLSRLASQAENLALPLQRPVDVEFHDNGVRTPSDVLDPLWLVVLHLIRNALDHGTEAADERKAWGKSQRGCLFLSTGRAGHAFVLCVRDDGAGIQWDALRNKARAVALPSTTRADQEALLFTNGVSSREVASQVSGRGIGLAAVQQAVHTLGGTISVHSTRGVGTTFECTTPNVFGQSARMVG